MTFIDSHCHFNFSPFSNQLAESLALAEQAGVKAIVIPGTVANSFPTLLALSAKHPSLFPALGLHPVFIDQHTDTDLDSLAQLVATQPQILALGEIGLDFFDADASLLINRQLQLLDDQLVIAQQAQLPIILHSRRSHDRLAQRLKQANLTTGGVIHGFSGSYQQAKRFIDLGYYLGVGGTISYLRANKTRETFRKLPVDCLVLETDAPDMPLAGYQGQPNRPEQVVKIWQLLSELRVESPEQLMAALWNNTLQLFPKLSTDFAQISDK